MQTITAVGGCILAAALTACAAPTPPSPERTASPDRAAPKPLYRDPVHDGAADPVVVWDAAAKKWLMFYTNRRANVPNLDGVTWVHGTRIGIAESGDGGLTWKYAGVADIELPPDLGGSEASHWAPEIVLAPDGKGHMFLSVVPGVFKDWNHLRAIVHLISSDLRKWTYRDTLKLGSDRVIDACVWRMPDGTWRLWYKDERDGSKILVAESPDLNTWTPRGRAVSDRSGEGPKVVHWKGKFWMLVDQWQGLAVYRSDDAQTWERQPANLLSQPGTGPDDAVMGGHPDLVINQDRAWLFYFTHPGRRGPEAKKDTPEQRRSSIQVAEVEVRDGWLTCDRDRPARIRLEPPAAP